MQATSLIWLSRCPGETVTTPRNQRHRRDHRKAPRRVRRAANLAKAMHLHYFGVRFSGRPDGSSFHS